MNRSPKKLIRLLAALISAVTLLVSAVPLAASAAQAVEKEKSCSLTIRLAYGGTLLSGGVFNLYRVADISDYNAPRYRLTDAYSSSGVNLNSLKNTAGMTAAASALSKYVPQTADAVLKTSKGFATQKGLSTGVYLVVQTASPTDYSKASPFLVFLPMLDSETDEWEYDYTASPKITWETSHIVVYTGISVNKVWADDGYENERPQSITVGLYRDGSLYDTQKLSAANGWSYSWALLSQDYSWTVDETEVPDGYYSMVESDGGSYTITNTRSQVPLSAPLTVKKVWDDDDNADKLRPDSITVGLYRNGTLSETQKLSESNGWSFSWVGLDADSVWTVDEISVPSGYSMFLEQPADGYYVMTNTTGKVPKTGLVQWPIPVLAAVGILLIGAGALAGRRKKHEE